MSHHKKNSPHPQSQSHNPQSNNTPANSPQNRDNPLKKTIGDAGSDHPTLNFKQKSIQTEVLLEGNINQPKSKLSASSGLVESKIIKKPLPEVRNLEINMD